MRNGFLMALSRRFADMHLKNKLLICYGLLIVFVILGTGLSTYYYIQQYIHKQAGETLEKTLAQIETNIEGRINTYDELASKLIINEQLKFALYRDYRSADEYSYEYLNTILPVIKFMEKDKNILDISIYKNNNSMPEDGYNFLSIDRLRNVEWFNRYFKDMERYTVNDYIRLSSVKIWLASNESVKPEYEILIRKKNEKSITLLKPVIFNFEKLVGILSMEIRCNVLFNEAFNGYPQGMETIFIADDNGRILFSSRQETGKGDFSIPTEISTQTGNSEGRMIIKSETGTVMLLYKMGRFSGWKYYMEVPMSWFWENAVNLRNIVIIIACLSIIFSFMTSLAIAGMLTRRIAILSGKMGQVDDLSLDITVNAEGNDEIGKLARNYNRMIRKIRELVDSLKASQQSMREAELKALQAQINPHFLYNSLATIGWMVMDRESHEEKIVSMIKSLSTFYRLSLNKGREYLTVQDEVNQVKAYSYLQKIRLEEKINVHFDIEGQIQGYYILKLLVQPFVENAILHGTEHKHGLSTNIIVRGYEGQGRIVLEIIDDGIGMDMLHAEEYPVSKGYGIRNVHEKIQLQYGACYGVGIFSRKGIGTVVHIELPIVRENPNRF